MADPVPQGEERPTETTPLQSPSSPALDEGRFLPGTVLAQRYRIVSLLGRGGMGEVYRATDLLLGQQVALKFLPSTTGRDEAALSRFRNEVRMARQVSHPNVCRVYDIGEAEGLAFLTMEYVDGEDLESLLRRIGHLPQDKALEIVRKLCAGLAAAHDKGVIHRDLKPANIMLDGHGQVRVMDFGLAEFAGHARDVRSGTPAYLAPEQKAGREVTGRSDIYSLGVVVHEVYTGKRPSEKASAKVELDPAVAAVIGRCLAEDPRHRPSTALAVAAALPGGDPLAAALAAGETPSPEMVANAGPVEGMGVGLALLCVALLLAGVAGVFIAQAKQSAIELIHAPESPQAIEERARGYIRSFGYATPAKDTAMGIEYDQKAIAGLYKERDLARRAAAVRTLQPPAVRFWYREGPLGLLPLVQPWVTRGDPAFGPSSVEVVLDPAGRLVEFHAAPAERQPYVPGALPDWSQLFAAAGLDLTKFEPAQPQYSPRTAYDLRQAWKGVYPESPSTEAHVEAAAYQGRISSFRVVAPAYWTETRAMKWDPNALPAIEPVFFVLMPLIGVVMAWRNHSRGRADWNGAFRVGAFGGATYLAMGLLAGHHVAAFEGQVMYQVLTRASYAGLSFFFFYVAFEPYVRRRMPSSLISWNRILDGRWRDPHIGSDILIGLAAAAVTSAVGVWRALAGQVPYQSPYLFPSGSTWSAGCLVAVILGLGAGLMYLLMLVILRYLFRRNWLAASILGVIMWLMLQGWPVNAGFWPSALYFAVLFFVLARFGLVATAVVLIANRFLWNMPLTTDLSRWYAWQSAGTVLVLLTLAIYAFWANLGGRPLFREED